MAAASCGRRRARPMRYTAGGVCTVKCWLLLLGAIFAVPAFAWGDRGHEITALIAYRHLTPQARRQVDALLLNDRDSLTAADFGARAAWADRYRDSHRETAAWHFVDIEIEHPDLDSACFGFPPLPAATPASQGRAQDCIVNKVLQFSAELADPATAAAERVLAFKFLIHFIGDLHQPLHAADHADRGGNCILLQNDEFGKNLHAYWDVAAVASLLPGESAAAVAAELDARISPPELRSWGAGSVRSWALETFAIGRQDAYALPSRPACNSHTAIELSADYRARARQVAALQLAKAGIRMAAVLNASLQH